MEVDNPILEAREGTEHPSGREFNIKYDGVLGDPSKDPPKGVWFSATLYKDQLPTTTPYPTGGDKKKYWRLSIRANNLNLLDDDVYLYLAKECEVTTSTQHSLVFTKGKIDVIENNCRGPLDKYNNTYFWYDHTGYWMCPKCPIWTKLCLTWDINLTNSIYPNMFWDRVQKRAGV